MCRFFCSYIVRNKKKIIFYTNPHCHIHIPIIMLTDTILNTKKTYISFFEICSLFSNARTPFSFVHVPITVIPSHFHIHIHLQAPKTHRPSMQDTITHQQQQQIMAREKHIRQTNDVAHKIIHRTDC